MHWSSWLRVRVRSLIFSSIATRIERLIRCQSPRVRACGPAAAAPVLYPISTSAEAQLLRDQDEAHPADVGPQETPLVAFGAQRRDQALRLVETDRRNGHAGAARQRYPTGYKAVVTHAVTPILDLHANYLLDLNLA